MQNSTTTIAQSSALNQSVLVSTALKAGLCKAHGKITKIVDWSVYNSNKCQTVSKLRLSDGTQKSIVGWVQNTQKDGCNKGWNGFINRPVPKQGSELYIIAGGHGENNIISTSKETYQKLAALPECGVKLDDGLSPEEFVYIWADKCRVTGKVGDVARTGFNKCGFSLRLPIQGNDGMHYIAGTEGFYSKDFGMFLCLGMGPSALPINTYSATGQVTLQYYPAKGDIMYAVVNQNDGSVLKYGKDAYDNASAEPLCSASPKVQTFTGDLSPERVKQIQDAVENQFRHDFGAPRKKPVSESGSSPLSLVPTANADAGGMAGSTPTFGWLGAFVLVAMLALAGFLKHGRKRA